jgi:polysaccharide biosynthesis transport protein
MDYKHDESLTRNALRDFIFIIFEKARLILGIFLVVAFVAAVLAVVWPPSYEASAKFSLSIPQQLDPLQKELVDDYRNRAKRLLEEQKALINSNRVLQKVVEESHPNLKGEELSKWIEKMRKKLTVTPPRGETFEGSSVFFLVMEDPSPRHAVELTKSMVKAYLEVYTQIAQGKTDYSYDFFDIQARRLYDEMLASEKKLREFESEKALVLIEILNLESGKANMEVGPNALLTEAKRRHNELAQELAGMKMATEGLDKANTEGKVPVVLPDMEVHGRAVNTFKNKVAQLEIQMNEMKSQYKSDFLPLEQTKAEHVSTVKSLRDEINRTVEARRITTRSLVARMQELEKTITALQGQIQANAADKSAYQHLKHEYEIAKTAYVGTRAQLEQSRLARSLNREAQVLTQMDEPIIPYLPAKPNRPLILVLGLVAGILLGIATALTIDHFDHTIKKPEDISRYLKIQVLGSIPKCRQ